ncbi:hypothetical protein BVY01_01395 [bacterium I07]|nr:hypothetical protein BVY01_01395 [bacterium I07]
MITMEDWVTIKNLKKRHPGMGTRKIAELLGVSRNTVRRALRSEKAPEYTRDPQVNPEIEPFCDYIYEKLLVKRLRGSRILKNIRSKGYQGSQSAFYRHLAKLREPNRRTYQRYETGPGEQALFDWSQYTVRIEGKLTKLYVFNYILGFSRYRVYEASLSQTQGSVFEAMEKSIHQTGGVTERVQTDNAKCFVTNCSKDNFQWNKRYLAFCGHYGFKPSRCLPGHAWANGKVENPFDYLEDHFIEDNAFSSFEDFLARLKKFETEVNARKHGTTHLPPDVLFDQERSFLLALPESRYVDIKEQVRKATADCLISFDGNRYSVPWIFATKEVWIRVSRGYFLEIYSSQNRLVARHKISLEKGKIIINAEHYKNHKVERGNWGRLCKSFLAQFPDHAWFLDKLKTQKRINTNYHLTQILDTARYFSKQDTEQAFAACRNYNVYTSSFVRGFLENNAKSQEPVTRLESPVVYQPGASIKRPLQTYQMNLMIPPETKEGSS